MAWGIVICHSKLSFALQESVEKILGHSDGLMLFSNEKLSRDALYESVLTKIHQSGGRDFVVMVDLRGGSCWMVGKLLTRDYPGLKVLSGVNLPMLISFLTKRDKLPFDELVKTLATDALRGIVLE